ncbi:acyl-CoA dehydrogenase domain-containing protein [Sphingobium chlorophenolicum L-1]|uniref:Acyl-CoA dehydrogenase domain-containing protein n=1 Tax=Sphingobium chlorophenolicum L-1 TaxID=690566 RepID=F6EW88_SPHCR|nr:acyl-CoA dehydrogenase family protein [Sphingobium chlorophenolicum]AEG49782.1 acyl-CoA dehydrogenase domain-containing protein [Sphingobium chlorophenolicum L-1]
MDFSHPHHRQLMADNLGRYLSQHYPIEERHRISQSVAGRSPQHWAALAEMGMIGALFAERDGGFGGDAFDIAVVFEQLGRALVVEPFLGTLLAGTAVALAGGHDERLGEVIAGNTIISFAADESMSRFDHAAISTQANSRDGAWTVTGAKAVVSHLEASDLIVVSARTCVSPGDERIGLFLVASDAVGVTIRGYPLIDGGRAGELTLNDAPAIALANDGLAILELATARGILALCWEAIGIMDRLKHDTLEYLRTRRQFGAPIGKFQALQHRMATVSLEIEQARSSAINAAVAFGDDRVCRERAISAAKFTIGRIGTLVAEEAIQMHGGIGMTWELPLSHYAKRLIMIGHQLGDEDHHLERFMKLRAAAPA